ncbi:MAG: DUF5916 domain-containing protein [Acidobacteriota bacterium]
MIRIPTYLLLAVVLVLATVAGPVGAQPDAGRADAARAVTTEVRPVSGIAVDGVIGTSEWAGASVLSIPWEWFPVDNAAAPVDTEVFLTFDQELLYVAFRAADAQPAAIRAHLADRDSTLRDDAVGFEIDTFDDRRRAYRFQVNPLGVQVDAQLSDVDGSEDFSWDAIWTSAGRLTPTGYEVELAIPFKQLRFPRAQGPQTWGFLAYRNYPRSVLHELKSVRNDRDRDCRICKYSSITGFQDLDTGYNLELTPTLTGRRTDSRASLGEPLENGDDEFDAGLTARWGITSNISLHATVNPDFSQVEADVAQLDVNERFALFFPEKRPFFLEGADYFSTPFTAVFTRTIADPEGGLRLTGKQGKNAFGVLVTQDRITNLLFPGPESSSFAFLDDEVTTGVLRYRRDIGETSTLGFLYTGRDGDGYSNDVYGVDGSLRLTDSDTLRFQILESRTEYPDAVAVANGQPTGSFDDLAYRADLTRSTGDWFFQLFHSRRGDDFRADTGFIPRVGFEQTFGFAQRNFWGEADSWYSRLAVVANAVRLEDLDGDLIEQGGNLELIYEGPLQSFARLGLRPNEESFLGSTFDNFRADLTTAVRPTGDLTLELFLRGGEVIDFTNVRQADVALVRPKVSFKIGRRTTGEVQHEWQELSVPGGRFLTANLSQGRVTYFFTRRAFLRTILQYRDISRRPELYSPANAGIAPEEQDLFTQLLFSYKLNARTVFLAGYSDNYQGDESFDLTQRSRTFFVKLGYAFLW